MSSRIGFELNGVKCHLTFADSEHGTPQGWAKPEYLGAAGYAPIAEVQQLYETFVGSGHCPKNPREAAQAIGQMRGAEEEIARFHKLLLDRTGATQLETIDIIMGRWLDQLAELEKHHREHHNCTECEPCIAHRGLS